VHEVASLAGEVVSQFTNDVAGLFDAEVRHIGATAMPFGHTKGDVDVNIRVEPGRFDVVVAALEHRFAVAQAENWTPTFASFWSDDYALPLGIQVTAIGSDDDFLLTLHERIHADPVLLQEYDDVKLASAARGVTVYWEAKNAFLRRLLA
jgi:GrpB-like predicted nucleotidyltransferase (UPF0157 family)